MNLTTTSKERLNLHQNLNLITFSELTGLPLEECRRGRIEYLRRYTRERLIDALGLMYSEDELTERLGISVFHQILPACQELYWLTLHESGRLRRGGSVDDRAVEAARAYPIDNLVEFNVSGRALAWCHEDKRPSLAHWKAQNRATCFVCGKSWNPIDVLMDRDGFSFQEAVRRLAW